MESCGKDEICIRVRLDNNMGFYKNRREGLNSCIHGHTISVPHMEKQALHTADGMFFLVNSEKKKKNTSSSNRALKMNTGGK